MNLFTVLSDFITPYLQNIKKRQERFAHKNAIPYEKENKGRTYIFSFQLKNGWKTKMTDTVGICILMIFTTA